MTDDKRLTSAVLSGTAARSSKAGPRALERRRPLAVWMTRYLVALVSLLAALGARPAQADGAIEVYLSVKAPDPGGKNKNDAPTVEATIVGGPTLPADKFTITEPGAKKPFSIKATSLRSFAAGSESIAVAFVFNGQEVWPFHRRPR